MFFFVFCFLRGSFTSGVVARWRTMKSQFNRGNRDDIREAQMLAVAVAYTSVLAAISPQHVNIFLKRFLHDALN